MRVMTWGQTRGVPLKSCTSLGETFGFLETTILKFETFACIELLHVEKTDWCFQVNWLAVYVFVWVAGWLAGCLAVFLTSSLFLSLAVSFVSFLSRKFVSGPHDVDNVRPSTAPTTRTYTHAHSVN